MQRSAWVVLLGWLGISSFAMAKALVFTLVVTANTPYVGTSFQIDSVISAAKIAAQQRKGYFPIRVQYGGNRWAILYTEAGDWYHHRVVITHNGFPSDTLQRLWQQGWMLLDADHQDSLWMCIFVQPMLPTRQRLSTLPVDPSLTLYEIQQFLQPLWEQGWRIQCATVVGDSLLFVWNHRPEQQQKVLLLDTFRDYALVQLWQEGYHITGMTPLGEYFFTILTKGTNWGKQIGVMDTRAATMSQLFLSATQRSDNFVATELVVGTRSFPPPVTQNGNHQQYDQNLRYVFSVATQRNLRSYQEFIEDYAPEEPAFRALQNYVGYFLQHRRTDSAIAIYQRYAQRFPQWQQRIARILEILQAPQDSVVITNLGPAINTRYHEFAPTLTLDEKQLYFGTANRPDGNGGEDIFYSRFENGRWTKAKSVGPPLNTRSHEAPLAVSPDGTQLLVFGNYPGGVGNGDLFLAHRDSTGWSSPRPLPPPVNSKYFEGDACFTPDGKAILFISDRPVPGKPVWRKNAFREDGLTGGDLDIYITFRTDTGWSQPINLGPVVNTPFAERSPFLHPDGRTLYFSSAGHPGIGKLDVFKTVRLSDTSWTQWSEPVNLGAAINGPDDDWGYVVSRTGDVAYCAQIRPGGYGANDIYKITLPEKARPLPVVTVTGIVRSSDGKPLFAKIRWEDLETAKVIGELSSDPGTGRYTIALPLGKHYGFYAIAEGYYPLSQHLDLRDTARYNTASEVQQDIVLVPIEQLQQQTLELRNIFFEFNSATLRPESLPELRRLAKFLHDHPEMHIEIIGHTDNVGSKEYNLRLSRQRAASVAHYLQQLGVAPERIRTIGKGESEPVASNATEAGRAQNRRVEFRLFSP